MPGSQKGGGFYYLLLSTTLLLTHGVGLKNEFNLDDVPSLTQNTDLKDGISLHDLITDASASTTSKEDIEYRPLTVFLAAHQVESYGYDPRPWHGLNLALHTWVCVMFLLFGRRLLGSLRSSPLIGLTELEGDQVAAAAALIFAVHPVSTIPLNLMWARTSLLVVALTLPAMILELNGLRDQRISRLISSRALVFLALLFHSSALSMVFVLLVLDFLYRKNLNLRQYLGATAGWVVVVLPWTFLSTRALTEHKGVPIVWPLAACVRLIWVHFGQIIVPVPPALHSAEELNSLSISDPSVLLGLTGFLIAFILAKLLARQQTPITLLIVSILILLSPLASSRAPFDPYACGMEYLSAGFLMLLFTLVLRHCIAWITRNGSIPFMTFTILITLDLAHNSRRLHRAWRTDLSLWTAIVETSPRSSMAHLHRGVALMNQGQLASAHREFEQSLRLDPKNLLGLINAALVEEQLGHREDVLSLYDRAVQAEPDRERPWYWRAVYRARSGDLAGARSDLERAISCDPGGVRDREALARVLAQLGLLDEAREVIERSFFLDPEGFARIRQEIGGTVNPAAFRNTDTLEEIDQALENGANPEIQTALGTLAKISDPLAVNRLSEWLERLESGKLDPSLALDVLEAAAQRPTLASRVRDHESGLDPRDHLGPWRVTLRGGNATLGRDVYHRQDLGCANCHTKQGGVDGGPDLSGVGTRRYRAQLLEAIVFPTQEISPEYRESKAMPDGLHLLMSKRDLRDLIEYLAHLD